MPRKRVVFHSMPFHEVADHADPAAGSKYPPGSANIMSTPLRQSRSDRWDCSEAARGYRTGLRAERSRHALKDGIPLISLLGFLGVLLYVLARHGGSLFLYASLGFVAITLGLLVAWVQLLRMISESLHEPLVKAVQVVPSQGLTVTPEEGSGEWRVPWDARRIFVSPPGFNVPRRARGGILQPRSFLRVVPEGTPFRARSFPVPAEAARAVHEQMALRYSFTYGRLAGRNAPTRQWILYRDQGPPGRADGPLARVEASEMWTPGDSDYIVFRDSTPGRG